MSTRPASSFLYRLFFLSLILSGCSVYKSEGRKFLEDQGITFAANAGAAVEWSFKAQQVFGDCAELFSPADLSAQDWQSFSPKFSTPADIQFKKERFVEATAAGAFDVLFEAQESGRFFLCALYFEDSLDREQGLEDQIQTARQNIQTLIQY